MSKQRQPHPGKILKKSFIDARAMSQNLLADAIGVPRNRIHAIVNGTRSITADTDLRLCKFFGLQEGHFLQLQNAYDLSEAKQSGTTERVKAIVPYSYYEEQLEEA